MSKIVERHYHAIGNRIVVKEDPPDTVTPGGVHLPDEAQAPPCRGVVLDIGDLVTIPVRTGDRIAFSPLSPQEIELHNERFTMTTDQDVFLIEGSEQRAPILYDYRLPPGSTAGDRLAWLASGHTLIRPYSPIGFTESGIFVEKDTKHPKVWAFILAVGVPDYKRYGIYPGDFVVFSRHSSDDLQVGYNSFGFDYSTFGRKVLPIAITKAANVQAVYRDSPIKPEF